MATSTKYEVEAYKKMDIKDLASLSRNRGVFFRRGHLLHYQAAPLYFALNWPARHYYVFLDWDQGDGIAFDKEPMWTDENGFLHRTKPGASEQVHTKLKWLPFKASKRGTPTDVVLLYHRDRSQVVALKMEYESAAKAGNIPPKFDKYKLKMFNGNTGRIIAFPGHVDRLKELVAFKDQCDQLLQDVVDARTKIEKWAKSGPRQVFLFRRQINAWLDDPDYSGRCERLLSINHKGKKRSTWDVDNELFMAEWRELHREAARPLLRLFEFLRTDEFKELREIDLVDQETLNGDCALWRQQFISKTLSELASSAVTNEVFNEVVRPFVESLGRAISNSASACKCGRCYTCHRDVEPPKDPLAQVFTAGDYTKLSLKTLRYISDVMYKFSGHWAMAVTQGNVAISDLAGWLANIVGRSTGAVDEAADLSRYFNEFLGDAFALASNADESAKTLMNRLDKAKSLSGGKLAMFSNALKAVGAAIVFAKVYDKNDTSARDAVSVVKAAGEASETLIFLDNKLSKGRLPKGYSSAAKWLKVGGAGLTIVLGGMSMREAADNADGEALFCATIVTTGGAVMLYGAYLDATGVGASVGVIMNVVGGVMVVIGEVAGMVTADDPEEKLLKAGHYLKN
jgi:hypothetical protein